MSSFHYKFRGLFVYTARMNPLICMCGFTFFVIWDGIYITSLCESYMRRAPFIWIWLQLFNECLEIVEWNSVAYIYLRGGSYAYESTTRTFFLFISCVIHENLLTIFSVTARWIVLSKWRFIPDGNLSWVEIKGQNSFSFHFYNPSVKEKQC